MNSHALHIRVCVINVKIKNCLICFIFILIFLLEKSRKNIIPKLILNTFLIIIIKFY